MDFGVVIEVLKLGFAVRRKGWNGKGSFIVKQIPSHIEGGIIPEDAVAASVSKEYFDES